MAYAALLSALQALKKATQQDFISNLFSIKHQITILDEKFCFLRDFLENDPPPASRDLTHILEGRIREAAYRAEDIIDFHIQNQIVPVPVPLTVSVPIPVTVKTSYWRTLSAFWRFLSLSDKQRRIKDFRADNCVKLCHVRADSCVKLYQEFQKVVDEVESILQQVELIKESREFESLHMNDHHPTGDADDVESMKHKRRLWFSKSVECLHFKSAIATNPPARSVFCCSYKGEVLNGFNQLKILHILEVNFESFPCEILQLRRLKFIAFSSGFIRYCTLPPSLPKLEHLQSLIVSSSVKFSPHEYRAVAPLPIWDMPQLRHLVFLNITLSPAYGVLENLQTLSRVRNFIFSREAIERLPNLKRLKAIYTGHDPSLYELGNLIHLDKLETLNLFFAPSSRMERVEGVRFGVPLGIKKLTLGGCGISWEEMRGMIGSLVNLEVLKLEYLSVVGEEWVAVEGDFPMLKFLLMERLDLRCWMAEGVDFPSLQRLIIRHCSRLEGIPCGVGEIPTLEVIEVDHCTPMAADSAREILEEQVTPLTRNCGVRVELGLGGVVGDISEAELGDVRGGGVEEVADDAVGAEEQRSSGKRRRQGVPGLTELRMRSNCLPLHVAVHSRTILAELGEGQCGSGV
ncbi:hypothetical protein SASPL_141883 [Salvia splendens]|uniref:Disease resistance R13L4/SHOC-2-like LRR domain-containing protein n=1 Tax=Salvia splendens TaxID=180675 RepID=A0A8X8Z9B0_SALSN|nr:hypothetical protein SASPL_141883 [Salvia splendens]